MEANPGTSPERGAREPVARARSVALGMVCLWAIAAAPAWGADGCRTFFPDFDRDCDRQVRPEGSVMPMSAPYIFEDPYIQTGLNFVGIWHDFPEDSIFEGGQAGVLALQARLAITDRVAFIATKDGLAFFDLNAKAGLGTKVLGDDTGFMNISAGFKVKAWDWQEDDRSAIVTPSLRYEIPTGNQDVYQGHDDGIFIPAVSAAYQHGPWHVIGDLGGQIAPTDSKNSSLVFFNLHLDHAFETGDERVPFVVPFVELNGLHYTGSGDGDRKIETVPGLPASIRRLDRLDTALGGINGQEGVDVANLGNKNVAGNDIVTMAWGLRLPLQYGLSFGAAYERPISNKKDIFEQRVTMMLTWEL